DGPAFNDDERPALEARGGGVRRDRPARTAPARGGDRGPGNEQVALRVRRVLARGEVEAAPGEEDVAAVGVGVVVRAQRVASRVDRDLTGSDYERVLAAQPVLRGGDGDLPAGEDEVLLARDPIRSVPGDGQRARAGDLQVRIGEDRRVNGSVPGVRIRIGDRVLGAVC